MECFGFSFLILAILSGATAQVAELEGLDFESIAAEGTACNGRGKVCVLHSRCESGFIDGNSLPRNYVDTELCHATDICCTIKPWDPENAGKCAIRSLNTYPQGPTSLNANFAEFPWQAMILRESTKSLLCGGVIIKRNFVLTSGDCVAGQKTIDVLTKGGEWKLGSDDEGKPFQIVRLKSMSLHPNFNYTKLSHNLAVLHLERDYQFDEHIEPLCLADSEKFPDPSDNQNLCIITGWGREALRIHQKDAIEHYTNLTFIPTEDCIRTLGIDNFNPDVSACAVADSNACNFDFGSALACQQSSSQDFVLQGIYTHNSGCFEPSTYGSEKPTLVFVKPDIEWLNRITKPRWNV